MAATENDLLQRFINNEKKSRTWTLLSVIAFCVFAIGIIYLAGELQKANKIIEAQHAQLEKSLVSANSLNDSLTENQVSLENMSNNFNQLKHERDSLIGLLKKMPGNTNPIENKYVQAILQNNKKYKVYIQYMARYEDESKSILSLLPKDYYFNLTKTPFRLMIFL